MKHNFLNSLNWCLAAFLTAGMVSSAWADDSLTIVKPREDLGTTPPIPVSISGFTGEGLSVLKFDLYVQGFSITSSDAAKYLISGSDAGNVVGVLKDKLSGQTILSQSYSGASLRRQAHSFANAIVEKIQQVPGIGLTRIAYKKEVGPGHSEIYTADFDGANATPLTQDGSIVAAPCWMPHHMAVYYTSYAPGNPDIYLHNLASGQRSIAAGFPGLNTAPACSADGSRLAMVLSRSGAPNIWVANANGTDPVKLTSTSEDSSPCWSPDGQWICFATKIHSRRVLAKVSAGGGEVEALHTGGLPSPTEPDWSPDGKFIAYTCQSSEFDICVLAVDGSMPPTVLVRGEDPSWSPNSRTLVFARRDGYHYTLSVLDVMTKQVKDIRRISGNDSQPAWAR